MKSRGFFFWLMLGFKQDDVLVAAFFTMTSSKFFKQMLKICFLLENRATILLKRFSRIRLKTFQKDQLFCSMSMVSTKLWRDATSKMVEVRMDGRTKFPTKLFILQP